MQNRAEIYTRQEAIKINRFDLVLKRWALTSEIRLRGLGVRRVAMHNEVLAQICTGNCRYPRCHITGASLRPSGLIWVVLQRRPAPSNCYIQMPEARSMRIRSSHFLIWNVRSISAIVLVAFGELRKPIISFVMSVCPSVLMEKLQSHWTDFDEIWCLSFCWKSV